MGRLGSGPHFIGGLRSGPGVGAGVTFVGIFSRGLSPGELSPGGYLVESRCIPVLVRPSVARLIVI